MIRFKLSADAHPHAVGILPAFFSPFDPRPAREQLHENYAHGGGVRPFTGFALTEKDDGEYMLEYPGDPAYHQVAIANLRDETIVVFNYAWVAIIQPDETHIITRCD